MINSESKKVAGFPGTLEDMFNFEPQYTDEGDEIYRAGQLAPAGTYLEVDGIRTVTLDKPGSLPASCGGKRTEYKRLQRFWGVDIPARAAG
jgi:hypothetical protein